MVARSANAVATMKAWGAQVQGTTTVPMMLAIIILMTALNPKFSVPNRVKYLHSPKGVLWL